MRSSVLATALSAAVSLSASVAAAQAAGDPAAQTAPDPGAPGEGVAPQPQRKRGERGDEPRPAPAAQSEAQQHFERALEHYRAGRYRAAIDALRAALALDPGSKDLVYNLALVHEKLGELDAAILALQRYLELEEDPVEVQRAEQAITRMRGAREQLEITALAPMAPSSPPSAPPQPTPTPANPAEPQTDRVDSWLLAGAGVAAVSALVGVVFGARALAMHANAGGGSAKAREDRERQAEESALIADIGFSMSLLASAGTALLWFGRSGRAAPSDQGVGLSVRGAF